MAMIVAVCKMDLVLAGPQSLKEKRMILRRIKDSIMSAFKVPIAEVDANDLWQRTSLGFALVGNERPTLNALVDKICDKVIDLAEPKAFEREFEFIDYHA